MKTLALLFTLICQPLFAGTPTEALTTFLKAAKAQNFEETWENTAKFDGASDEVTKHLQSRVQKILKLSAEGWRLEILEERISGECAVLVLNEINKDDSNEAFDFDPAFLIKQKGEWRVLPDITKWNLTERIPADKQPASMKLDESKLTAYKDLEKWFEERKVALKKKKRAK